MTTATDILINVFVPGVPVEKGNMVVNRFGGGMHDTGGTRLRDWMTTIGDYVALAASHGAHADFPIYADPDDGVRVDMTFILPRPKTVRRPFPTRKHDRDKLERAVHDALTGIAYADDGQSCDGRIQKLYAEGEEATGVHLVISRAELPEGRSLL